jgi:hypothetical protein
MNEFPDEDLWAALEERHNDLIARLDELNEQIEAALAELGRPVIPPSDKEAA